MTKAEIVADLKNMIGPGCEVDDGGLAVWVNEAYLNMCDEIVKSQPEFFVDSATTSTVADRQEYDLSTLTNEFDKIMMVNIAYDGSTWHRALPLNKIGDIPTHADTSSQGFSQAEPYYYLISSTLGFMPIPDANGLNNIKVWYTYTPDELSADSDSPALPTKYHHIIKLGAYANYLDQDDEHVAAERMRNRFDLRIFNMVEQLAERQVDQPKSVEISQNQDMYLDDWGMI